MRVFHWSSTERQPAGRWVAGLLLQMVLLCGLGEFASAQYPQARLYSLFPTGGQRGTSVDVSLVNGADLDETSQLIFSHPGITAVQKTTMVDGKPQPVTKEFTVSIAADVPPGLYDVRSRGLFGLSNPRTFVVGDRKELLEVEPNNELAKPQVVELNATINGASNGGADVDCFKVTLAAGQRLLADCRARRIDSRMSPIVELYDPQLKKVATVRSNMRQDAILDYLVPANGEYIVRLFDSVFGGSADHGYRLTLHVGPQIDFVLPSSGLAGSNAEYTIYGRNLPGGQPSPFKTTGGKPIEMLKTTIALPGDPSALQAAEAVTPAELSENGVPFQVASPVGTSNPVLIHIASAPVALEVEPNDAPAQAQKLTPPVEVTGQFATRADVDLYAFDATAGATYWIEVYGQRNGGPTDPYFSVDQVVKNDKGEETVTRLTLVDDNPVNLGGNAFNTLSDDPVFRFVAPANATYRVAVRDRYSESRGDPALTYRLAIRAESPDYRLIAVAPVPTADPNQLAGVWELGIRKGDNLAINVMAFRQDGFTGPIDVKVEGLPAGVTSKGTTIGLNQVSATLVISSTDQAAEWTGPIKLIGTARIEDPAAAKAVVDSEAALKAAQAALPPLDKPIADAQAAATAAQTKVNQAQEALNKDQNNEGLKKAKADADAALVKANEVLKAATDKKAAAEKQVADTTAAVAAAKQKRDQATKDVVREARGGTVIWAGNPQLPSVARGERTLMLSVLREAAQFQPVAGGERRFEVNQNRQVLIPVTLAKRNGFDNPVALTFINPPPNLQVENKPIEKGKADGVYRLFVAGNVAPGTYTFLLQAAGPISYSRNPEAAAAAAKEKEVADKALVDATEATKKATEAKTAADKKMTDTAAAAKKAVDDKVAIDKQFTDADAAAKKAAEEKLAADKAATDTEAASKAAADAANKAKEAAAAKPDDKALQDAKPVAEKAAADAAEAAKKAAEAKVAAEKKLADAQEALKKATEAKTAAEKLIVDSAAAAKAAAEEKVAADKLLADTTAAQQKATAVKQAADKKATDTANVSKPANLNIQTPVEAITLVVKPSPGTLAVNPANGGALKRGANVEVKVTLNRANGFAGPATLSLPLPPGVAGLAAPEVTIPADKNEGTLVIAATGDATMGQIPNLVVRASMEFNGPAAIDQPVTINVQP